MVAIPEHPQNGPVVSRATVLNLGARRAAIAVDRASFGSFFWNLPEASTRARAANVGGTSTTCSPAANNGWERRCPRPFADSMAQSRSGKSIAHLSSRSI